MIRLLRLRLRGVGMVVIFRRFWHLLSGWAAPSLRAQGPEAVIASSRRSPSVHEARLPGQRLALQPIHAVPTVILPDGSEPKGDARREGWSEFCDHPGCARCAFNGVLSLESAHRGRFAYSLGVWAAA